MKLQTKLIASFMVVIGITAGVCACVGVFLIGEGIVREAQNKVTLDLNSARWIYDYSLQSIEKTLYLLALKTGSQNTDEPAFDGRVPEIAGRTMEAGGLDMLFICDSMGKVKIRCHNPGFKGDSIADDSLVRMALAEKTSVSGTQIFTAERLERESELLSKKACIVLKQTPRARESGLLESRDGMFQCSAVPVIDERGELTALLYGAKLLNRKFEIVDEIKAMVYRDVRYKGRETGTATIFQDDVRISTNVLDSGGNRAVGTRVSSAVYERVFKNGVSWTEPAFVVNDWYLTAYEPIRDPEGDVIGMLYVGMLEKKYTDIQKRTLWLFFSVAVCGILIAGCVSCLLSRAIVKPVRELERGVKSLANGDFDFNVRVSGRDEISSLAVSFLHVSGELKKMYRQLENRVEAADDGLEKAYRELREKQDQLVQAEKLASMGQLSAGIAHEINNPLGTILLHSHFLLQKTGPDDKNRSDFQLIADESARCRTIVRGLLDFARETRVDKILTDLDSLINDTVAVFRMRNEKNIHVEFRAGGLPAVPVDPDQMRQVLVNLLDNSYEAVSSGEIIIESEYSGNGDYVLIRISDTGDGIAEEHIGSVFNPFFTTKDMGKGTGLGLAIVYGIIKMHSGNIHVQSAKGRGSVFTIELPVLEA